MNLKDFIFLRGFSISFFGESPEFKKQIQEQVILSSFVINETTEKKLKKILEDGIIAGVGEDTTYTKVQELFEGMADYRAKTIARTETARALNTAHQEAYKQIGIEKKEWLSAEDARVRPTHADANGQVRLMNEPFDVGGSELMHPSDWNAPIEETVNCRCREIPYFE
jgi:SPP1 gp7 family putative phage head morphogenesis protein